MKYLCATVALFIVFFIFDYGCGHNLPVQNSVVVDKNYTAGYYQISTDSKGVQTMTWIDETYKIRVDLGFGDQQGFSVSSGLYHAVEIGDEVKATQREGRWSKIYYNAKIEKY